MMNGRRCTVEGNGRNVMKVGRLDMSDEDWELIAHQCRAAGDDKIIITHGTDTMSVTARVLAEKVPGKTIVLTGAMIPYKFGSSDGFFNLGSALAFAQILPPGVYVPMNGRSFTWDNLRKNRQTGQFEEL